MKFLPSRVSTRLREYVLVLQIQARQRALPTFAKLTSNFAYPNLRTVNNATKSAVLECDMALSKLRLYR